MKELQELLLAAQQGRVGTDGTPFPSETTVRHAELWLMDAQRNGANFAGPHVTWDVMDRAILLEWLHGRRKLAVYVSEDAVEGLAIRNINGEMEDVVLDTDEQCASAWKWLQEDSQ